MQRFGEGLVRVAYVAFFLMLVFAVADYGLTRTDSLPRFQMLLGGVLILWLLGCAFGSRFPRTGWIPWVPVLLLLGFGWIKAGVGYFFHLQTLAGTELAFSVAIDPETWVAGLSRWGSVRGPASMLSVGTATVLLGAMLLAIEIWRDALWGRFLLLTMILIGFGITVLFLLQVTVGAPFQLLNVVGGHTRFFVYNYHGNGASFLNLFWPVALAVAAYCGLRKGRFWAMWIIVPVPMFAALFMNVSKAGNILAIAGIILFAMLAFKAIRALLDEIEIRLSPAMIVAVIVPLVVIGISCYFAVPWNRWEEMMQRTTSVEEDTRIRAYGYFVKMIPEAGWSGFGPGTFDATHRRYLKGDPILMTVPFWVAHQDYIQTVVEWGYVGTALWALILLPGCWRIARGIFVDKDAPSLPRHNFRWGTWDPVRRWFLAMPEANQPLLLAGAGTAIALTAIHAAFDFPMQVPSLGLYFLIWTAMGWSLLGRDTRTKRVEIDDD